MGIVQSKRTQAQKTLDRCLPGPEPKWVGGHWGDMQYLNEGRVIKSRKERRAFMKNVLLVLSGNGKINLDDFDIRLVYPRSTDGKNYQASVVALDGQKVVRSIGFGSAGKDKELAYRGLVRKVESLVGELIRDNEALLETQALDATNLTTGHPPSYEAKEDSGPPSWAERLD